ncbi:MAG TPA: phytanoyl-CoA dioxygenase family protein [Streptosporangiales bacterium]
MLRSNGYVLDESASRLGELVPVPDAERCDREALWRRLRRDGYLYLRGALDPDAVLSFRRHYFGALAETGLVRRGTDPQAGLAGDGEPDQALLRHVLFRQVVPGGTYLRFCTQPAIRGFYAWLLGRSPFLHRRKIIRHTVPGRTGIGTATQAHYDLVYLREGTDRVLSSWIPLGDCPLDRGGLVYLEGSHRRTLAEEQAGRIRRPAASITADLPALADRHDSRWLVTDYAAGDMVVHSAYVVHAALDNVDPGGVMRLSTDIRYQRRDEPIDWRWQNHWHDRDGL